MELDHVELDELRIRPSGNRPTDNLPVDAIKSSISGPCNKVEVTCAATAGVEFMSDP